MPSPPAIEKNEELYGMMNSDAKRSARRATNTAMTLEMGQALQTARDAVKRKMGRWSVSTTRWGGHAPEEFKTMRYTGRDHGVAKLAKLVKQLKKFFSPRRQAEEIAEASRCSRQAVQDR